MSDARDPAADSCGFPELLEAFRAIAFRQRPEESPQRGEEARNAAAPPAAELATDGS